MEGNAAARLVRYDDLDIDGRIAIPIAAKRMSNPNDFARELLGDFIKLFARNPSIAEGSSKLSPYATCIIP
jgi:hypothetical protein